MATGRLLIGACGAGMVLNLPDYLVTLRGTGLTIRVLLTHGAVRILPARTLALVCDDVVDCSEPDVFFHHNHVRLSQWADRLLVLPASANLLGLVATGQAPSLLAATILTHPRPVTFFPSMNPAMLANSAVRRNIARLRADGHVVVEPVSAPTHELASGTTQDAPTVVPPAKISEYLERLFASPPETEVVADAGLPS